MYRYEFRPQAVRDLKKLPRSVQQQIIKKLEYFLASKHPLSFATSLTNSALGEYRFRIGDYRVVFDVIEETIIILTIGHRREIYR